MTEINAQIPLSSMVGAINPSWGMAIRRFLNPDEWAANTVSTQLGDLASQVYELETQGNYDEARKKRFEYIKTAAQGMALPGESGAAIKQQFSSLNNALDSSSAEAIEAIKNSMSLNTAGYGNRIASPQEASQYDPNSQIKIGNAFSRNFHLIDRQSVFNDEHKRKLFNIQRGNENPYSQRTPEELADKYPKIPEINREQYQNLNDILGELQYIAQNGKTAEQRLNAAKGIVDITEEMRKLNTSDGMGDINIPTHSTVSDPVLAYWGVPETRTLPSVTKNNKGLVSTTNAEQPTTGEERARALLSQVKTKPAPPEWQDKVSHYVNSNQLTENQLKTVNATLENIDILNQIKTTLTNQAGENLKIWHNPISNKDELMPDFSLGQGFDGLVEHLKLNYNPFGIWQAMGASPTDGALEITEKARKLYTQNNQRIQSGLQTTDQEYMRMQQMFLEGLISGDANKFWTALRQAESYSHNALQQQKRALDESSYIPSSIRREFLKYGIDDPYPTIWEDNTKNNTKNLPPSTLPSKLSDKDLDEFHKLWNKVEPFKSMPEGTDEEKAAKLKAIQSFMLQRNNN